MQKNTAFLALIVTLTLIVFWYSGVFLYRYYNYIRLGAKAPTKEVTWTVDPRTDEQYLLKANYSFDANGQNFTGNTVLEERGYWNRYSAEKGVEEYSKKKWYVWYNPSDPTYSSLQKNFPLKECVSAAIMWAIVFYFVWLGYYAQRFRN
jgi:hypothetical protein